MMNIEMIKKLISKLQKQKNFIRKNLCLMHCVSNYPLEISDSNMNSIISLKKTGFEVGYSDHAIGIENC